MKFIFQPQFFSYDLSGVQVAMQSRLISWLTWRQRVGGALLWLLTFVHLITFVSEVFVPENSWVEVGTQFSPFITWQGYYFTLHHSPGIIYTLAWSNLRITSVSLTSLFFFTMTVLSSFFQVNIAKGSLLNSLKGMNNIL